MGELVLSLAPLLRGRRILEVGAGSHGIVALAAAHAGAASVLVTDGDAHAVERTAKRLRSHPQIAQSVRAAVLDWNHPEQCEALQEGEKFDVVLGCECVGQKEAASLASQLPRYLVSGGIALLLNGAARHRFGMEEFEENLISSAKACGLLVRQTSPPDSLVQRLERCNDHGLHSGDMEYVLRSVRKC